MNLASNCVVDVVQAAVAAGSTDVAGDYVDMSGFEGVLFLASLTPASTDSTAKVSAYIAATTTGAGVVVTNSSDETLAGGLTGTWVIGVDVPKPTKRYVRPYVTRGTSNTAIESVLAIRYSPKEHVKTSTGAGVLTWSTSSAGVTIAPAGASTAA